jgi:hypothetical protein
MVVCAPRMSLRPNAIHAHLLMRYAHDDDSNTQGDRQEQTAESTFLIRRGRFTSPF